mmetsp:Transcript_16130/g.14479  ORF Transcript_16130/g.14479 Transcript_16130/m.14479 type:complete len:376 (+) Transcript_16130:89-1216(+)
MALVKRRMSNLNLNLNQDKEEKESKPTDKFLQATEAKCSKDLKQLQFMHWMFTIENQLPTKRGCIKHIKRVSKTDKCHQNRKRPQFITSYYAPDKTLLIWILGTQNTWDWTNLLNVCHKKIKLNHPSKHSIKVHNGVYNAINNLMFYAPLFADIHIHFSDPNQPIEKVVFGGHSQGGAIAQLMFMLLRGQVECEFVEYFKEEMELTGIELNIDCVYTVGSVHVVSHNNYGYVDNIFGSSIINIINPIDPIPMMFAGNKYEPKTPLKPSKKLSFSRVCLNKYGNAMMKNFPKIASFGPIGKFIVFVDNELRVLHRKDDKHNLFNDHLVHGAHNYTLTQKKWTDLPTLIKLQKHHIMTTYIDNLDRILKLHINKLIE